MRVLFVSSQVVGLYSDDGLWPAAVGQTARRHFVAVS